MSKFKENIPYNEPHIVGNESAFLEKVLTSGSISGGGEYTELCHRFFQQQFKFPYCFLTSSCSSALDMAAQLCDFKPGDEVIMPSYNYTTVASSFSSRGAKLVFADTDSDSPHICPQSISGKISSKTKALVVVHYAGIACDMDEILKIVQEHNLILIEDCAHAINSRYKHRFLGSFGHFSTFSFHETKNVHCGEGGLLVVNKKQSSAKASQVWQEGTNRSEFNRGIVDKYQWVSLGSSYQPSELNAAFLYGQLMFLKEIHQKRLQQWDYYYQLLQREIDSNLIELPPDIDGHNGHIFFIKCKSKEVRNELIKFLELKGIMAIFHYSPLHTSPYWLKDNDREYLPNTEKWADTVLRLPIYYSLSNCDQDRIVFEIKEYLLKRKPLV